MFKIFILGLLLFFVGCSSKNLSPVNASDYFWEAQKERNYEDVKKFVRDSDKNDLKLQKSIKIKRYEFGETYVKEAIAKVPTKIYLEGFFGEKRSEEEVEFDTILVQEDDGWKVNLKDTRKALYFQVMKKFGNDLGSGIFGKIKEGLGDLEEFKNIFKGILKNMAESVKEVK